MNQSSIAQKQRVQAYIRPKRLTKRLTEPRPESCGTGKPLYSFAEKSHRKVLSLSGPNTVLVEALSEINNTCVSSELNKILNQWLEHELKGK